MGPVSAHCHSWSFYGESRYFNPTTLAGKFYKVDQPSPARYCITTSNRPYGIAKWKISLLTRRADNMSMSMTVNSYSLQVDPATDRWWVRPDGGIDRLPNLDPSGKVVGALVMSTKTGRAVEVNGWQFQALDSAGLVEAAAGFLVGMLYDANGAPRAAAVPMPVGDEDTRFFAVGMTASLATGLFDTAPVDREALRAIAEAGQPAIVVTLPANPDPELLGAVRALAGAAPVLLGVMDR